MRRIESRSILILIAVGLIFLAMSCDHDYEGVFPESPDERIQKTLNEYQNLLKQAPFGWNASLYTGTGAGYFYHLEFMEEEKVLMLSDFDENTAGESMEATWTIKALQRPTLSFTTYSYIHMPADPDGNINNGIPGSGLLSDFEFAFIRLSGDSIFLKGVQHGAEITLTRATEEERQKYYDKRIQQLIQNTKQFLSSSRGYTLTLPNNETIPMALSLTRKLISFQFLASDEESILTPATSFVFTISGIRLKEELLIKEYKIRELVWDDVTGSYYVLFDPPAIIAASNDPFIFYPRTELYRKLGVVPLTAVIPRTALSHPLPGHSERFTEAYQLAATTMHDGPYNLTLDEIRYVFIPFTNRMMMILSISQPSGSGGAARFTAQYGYSYLVREDGTVKFTLEDFDQNAEILFQDMDGILSHFNNDSFRLEYVGGDFTILAGFFSQEEPDYFFSGYLVDK